MSLPEGLRVVEDEDGSYIADAQDWCWVWISRGALGDPAEWHATIRAAVVKALGIEEES